VNINEKEDFKMEKIGKTLYEIILPYVIAQTVIVGFITGWTLLWIS
jgi:hypothetical protein